MKRPWKAHWPDYDNDSGMAGASFSTREGALKRAQAMLDEGVPWARIWQNDPQGYVVPGSTEMVTHALLARG